MKRVKDVVSNTIKIAIILTGMGVIYFSLFVELVGNTLWIRMILVVVAIVLVCLSLFLLIFEVNS